MWPLRMVSSSFEALVDPVVFVAVAPLGKQVSGI